MPFVILQRTDEPLLRYAGGMEIKLPGWYVAEMITRTGEFVLDDERSEAVRFHTEEEANKAIEKSTSNTVGCEVVELKGPRYVSKPSTPIGHVLAALEASVHDLATLRGKIPLWVSESVNDEEILALVKRIEEMPVGPFHSVRVILLDDHVRQEHKSGRATHTHWWETVKPSQSHDHVEKLDRLRKEVIFMARKGSAKAKSAAKGSNGKAPTPRKAKAERVEGTCHCGCGGTTFSNFVPGHDARVYSALRKEAKGETVKLPTALTKNANLLKTMREKVH